MWQDWLFELLRGIAKLFLNPLFYITFVFAAFLGVTRVKKERKHFTVRAQNAYFELKQLLPNGVIIGLCLSILSILMVLIVPMELIMYTGALTIVLALIGRTRLLSPVYTLGLGILLTVVSLYSKWDWFLFSQSKIEAHLIIFPTAIILLGLLLIAEGILIQRNGAKWTSPRLRKSKRGQLIGVHLSERVWMVPLFLFIPSGILTIPLEGWPAFTVGDQTYSLLFVPFLLGFKQEVQGEHPISAIKVVGNQTILLGIVIAVSAIASYYLPIIAIVSILLALIGREYISYRQKLADRNKAFYFTKKNEGVMVLGVVPESPAYKMDLQVGELITKVNNIPVQNKGELYHALQKNSAHCRIEVIDIRGEVRFAQCALYEGDHHELGALLIQDEKARGNQAV